MTRDIRVMSLFGPISDDLCVPAALKHLGSCYVSLVQVSHHVLSSYPHKALRRMQKYSHSSSHGSCARLSESPHEMGPVPWLRPEMQEVATWRR